MPHLDAFHEPLAGCRFCPMCKPAGEVFNMLQIESYSTRARAMMLWRIIEEKAEYSDRFIELLYQSTLDSISEAWCISHFPVSDYVLAARADVYELGRVPETVKQVIDRSGPDQHPANTNTLLLAGDAAELDDVGAADDLRRALMQVDCQAEAAVMLTGAVAYTLGARDVAAGQAQRVVKAVEDSGARTVIADSAQTRWALEKVYPALGIDLPEGVQITSASEVFADNLSGQVMGDFSGKTAFMLDSRSATLLADSLPKAEVLQPGYHGDEENLGTGPSFDAPRRVVDASGMQRVYTVWQRGLSRSSGADDGLWLTYPQLAEGLAAMRLAEAQEARADVIVTDSAVAARHLANVGHIEVIWLPQLLNR